MSTIYLAPFHALFATVSLSAMELGIVAVLSLVPAVAVELAKAARRGRGR